MVEVVMSCSMSGESWCKLQDCRKPSAVGVGKYTSWNGRARDGEDLLMRLGMLPQSFLGKDKWARRSPGILDEYPKVPRVGIMRVEALK